jgi:Ca2+/Na+ antiporter
MAISNAIGSNVFDILICLGVPWLFRTIDGDYITVKSKGNFENKINNKYGKFS